MEIHKHGLSQQAPGGGSSAASSAKEQVLQDDSQPAVGTSEEACKRCNCRKSKCLKLYCDCFAAGLYCTEPCSCQECFNSLSHEGTVREARKIILSRNPRAFAPKLIMSAESVPELEEKQNEARHKRGCNCKKSSCIKKYCECFQSGVGCSKNCRCEGCNNVFGRIDGLPVKSKGLQQRYSDLEKEKEPAVRHLPEKSKNLQEKYSDLEKEKETAMRHVEELRLSLNLEKQEHASFVKSNEIRLAHLEERVQMHEERCWRKKEFEEKPDKAEKSHVENENLILQKIIRDLEEKNLSLEDERRVLQSEKQEMNEQLRAGENREKAMKEELLDLEEKHKKKKGARGWMRSVKGD